jgi:hypothetical protein
MGDVWFAIPSASPERCRSSLPAWRAMGYKVAVLQNQVRADIPADICVWSDHYPGWAGSINQMVREIVPSSCPVIVSGGDDMLPDPNLSAEQIKRQFLERFPDTLGVMQPMGDQHLGAGTFCGSPWLGRAWCERAYHGAGPMFAGYAHNWADNELYWVARCLGVLECRADLVQRHEHFTRTGQSEPDYWTKNVSARDRADVQLFLARAWQSFPGHELSGAAAKFDASLFAREYKHTAEAYWIARYGRELASGDSERRMSAAIKACAETGARRVGIFGAGSHTRGLATALMAPACPIVCIIDDGPNLAGAKLWNYPIVSSERAGALWLDAVIISSRTMEQTLMERARAIFGERTRIVGLYEDERPATPATVSAPSAAHVERRPKVSTIIPMYNAGETIAQAIGSALSQGIDELEVLVVNDGSSDDGAEVVRSIAARDGRVRLIQQANAGAAAARNRGLDEARGEFVAFLDADDVLCDGAYQELLATMERQGTPAACGGFEMFTDAQGTLLMHTPPGPVLGLAEVIRANHVSSISQMVQRESIGALRFDATLAGYEDQDLWIRLAEAGVRWGVTPKVVARYRMRAGSLSKSAAMLPCAERVFTRAQARTRAMSEEQLRTRLADFSLSYSTRCAVGSRDGSCAQAIAMYERATVQRPIDATRAASAAHAQSVFALGAWPGPNVDAGGVPLSARLMAWWQACAERGWMDAGQIPQALRMFATLCVHPRQIAQRIIERACAGAELVVLGFGRNGRLLAQMARREGLAVEVRDQHLTAAEVSACLPDGASWGEWLAPIKPGALVVVSPLQDGPLALAYPSAVRWRAVRDELAAQPEAANIR